MIKLNIKKIYIVINFFIAISVFLLIVIAFRLMNMSSNIISASIISNSANEVRDFVGFRCASLIMEGHNPYVLGNLDGLTTPFLDLYPPLTAFIVALLCKISGMGIVEANYVVNLVFYFITSINVYVIVKDYFIRYRRIVYFAVLLYTASFFSMFGLPIFNFRLDAIGICIVTGLFAVMKLRTEKIMIVAFLSVVLVLTKQILVVFALPIFLYYLVGNCRVAMKYMASCLVMGICVAIVIMILFPLYWTETILAQFLAIRSSMEFISAIHNMMDFAMRYRLCLTLFFLGLIAFLIVRKKIDEKEKKYLFYLVMNCAVGFASLLIFSQSAGDGYKYWQDIMAPSLYIATVYMWSVMIASFSGKIKEMLLSVEALALCLLVISIYPLFIQERPLSGNDMYRFFYTQYYSLDDLSEYNKMYDAITFFDRGGDIYLGLNSTGYTLKDGEIESPNRFYNDGHIEYFAQITSESVFLNKYFYLNKVGDSARNYVRKVNEKIENEEFDVIAICLDGIINKDVLSEHYLRYKSYRIKNDINGIHDVVLWIRKG